MSQSVHPWLLCEFKRLSQDVLSVTVIPFAGDKDRLIISLSGYAAVQEFRKNWRSLPETHPARRKLDDSDIVYNPRYLKIG